LLICLSFAITVLDLNTEISYGRQAIDINALIWWFELYRGFNPISNLEYRLIIVVNTKIERD
jgi:hypothetical protein